METITAANKSGKFEIFIGNIDDIQKKSGHALSHIIENVVINKDSGEVFFKGAHIGFEVQQLLKLQFKTKSPTVKSRTKQGRTKQGRTSAEHQGKTGQSKTGDYKKKKSRLLQLHELIKLIDRLKGIKQANRTKKDKRI